MLRDDLQFELAVTITGDFNRHFTKIASQCLTALAIVGITAGLTIG